MKYAPKTIRTPAAKSKRLAINMPPDLHRRFKGACALAGLSMVKELLALIERRTKELERASPRSRP